jgi:hypothetical protein
VLAVALALALALALLLGALIFLFFDNNTPTSQRALAPKTS